MCLQVHYRKVHHYEDDVMPPIHREKSLDEYCNNSLTLFASEKKTGHKVSSTNVSNSSVTDSSQVQRVSEGSPHSNGSTSSDTFEDSNNVRQQPLSSPISFTTRMSGNAKPDCMHSINVTNSNTVMYDDCSQVKFCNAEMKVTAPSFRKGVFNDIKMGIHNSSQDHPGTVYAHRDVKTIHNHSHLPSTSCQISDQPQFESASISSLFQE